MFLMALTGAQFIAVCEAVAAVATAVAAVATVVSEMEKSKKKEE
jgi:hypothetical protein